ncbi:heterokaryon incompatibility protein [Fusarium langsethiae]|uniref:Heterokaryon incompatibility protein n=1 Tax=Fusarium langsethiae TaxID=179993 RepID=A0A0N0V5Y5_FUSLA|nr:heterokaryon incompatibility protein [Fusarium langsethiae]GKU05753.1 unnamed protein product [Fusarium langsethiae]GKU21271.1 unnamed protein product [Fusarium langsethiae]
MWRSHLQGDLLWWACSNDKGVPTRYEAYIAPTWSWASIKGNVFTAGDESDRVEYLYEVDDYKLEYATEDKIGAIRSGWIRLSGQLRQLELRRKTTEGKKLWSLFIDKIEYDPEQYVDGETGHLWLSIWLDEQTDFDEESKSGTLYCMLARYHRFNEIGDASNMWDFLMFQLVDPSKGIFRRIGVARTRTGNIKNPYPTSSLVQGASSKYAKQDGPSTTTLPCAAYEGGVHSIYVI